MSILTTTATDEATAQDLTTRGRWWAQPPVLVFAAAAAVAVPVLVHAGRHRWFQFDEWDFLASREVDSLDDLLEPHSVHWVTLPVVAYRLLWAMVGIRSYVPYQVLSVLTHVGVVTLALVVARRAGARPWVATVAALPLLFLGSGAENIVWAFQITFTGSLLFGLAHLVLADVDGPLRRRDAAGLVAGLLGLLCSGLALSMVLAVGLACLARRGWRVAAFHVAPLAVVYLGWHLAFGRDAYGPQADGSLDGAWALAVDIVSSTVDGVGQVPLLGWVLVVAVGAGVVLRGRRLGFRAALTGPLAAPLALLVAAASFVVITAAGRSGMGLEVASNNRYIHVGAVLAMPAMTVGADELIRRWRLAAPALAVVAAVVLAGNVLDLREDGDDPAVAFRAAYRDNLVAMARMPLADEVPRSLHPDLALAPWVTMGWLVDADAAGRLPDPVEREPVLDADVEARLVLRAQPDHQPASCEARSDASEVTLAAGGSIVPAGPITITYVAADGTRSTPLPFDPAAGAPAVVAYAGPVTVEVAPTDGGGYQVCDADGGPIDVPDGP